MGELLGESWKVGEHIPGQAQRETRGSTLGALVLPLRDPFSGPERPLCNILKFKNLTIKQYVHNQVFWFFF